MVSTEAQSTPSQQGPGESPIDRAFRLLQTVVAAGESVGIRELSRRSGLPRSTVARHIGTLADLGMVSRAADGSVLPGTALVTLQPDAAKPMLGDQLRPLLSELASTIGENAALSIDDGDSLLYLAQVRSQNPVSVPDVTSERHAFHLVAPGLLTMAWWPKARLDAYLATELDGPTPTSVTSSRALLQRVRRIRTTGYAWTDQELDLGVNGLAVPILDEVGELRATVSVYGPSYRFSQDLLPTLGAELLDIVEERSSALIGP
jgi:IclR family acetate operon transcriptional repressor